MTLTGSNTFTGDYLHEYGVTVLNRPGGPALYASGSTGNLTISNNWGGVNWYGAVEMGAANQLGSNVNVTFSPQNLTNAYSYLVLKGNDTTIGNLSSTANYGNAWAVIENAEGGSAGLAASRLTVTQTTNGTFTGEFRDGNWNGGGGIGLTKDGAATLTLAGVNTGISYTGGTVVNAGRLVVSSTHFNSPVSVAAGASFESNAAVNQALKAAVVVSGSGAFVKSGTGQLTLTSANTNTGGTIVEAGVLTLSAANRLADTGAVTVNAGGLDLGGYSDAVGAVTLVSGSIGNGTLTGASYTVQSGTISAALAGAGALTKTGTGTTVLSGSNTYAGTTTISQGLLKVGNDGSTGSLGSGNVVNNYGLAFARSDALTVSQDISGVGSVSKWGFGTITFTGSNTFTGKFYQEYGVTVLNRAGGQALYASGSTGTIVMSNFSGGVNFYSALEMAALSQLGANVDITFSPQNLTSAYAFLALKGNDTTIGNLTSTANYGSAWGIIENQETGSFGNSRLTVTQTVDGTFTGEFRNGHGSSVGTIGLTKNGPATLTLTDGGNEGVSYTGSTIVNAGRLVLKDARLFASAVTVNAGAALAIESGSAQTWNTAVTGSGSLVKQGAGTLTISTPLSYTGTTTVNAGAVAFSGSGALANGSSLVMSPGATIDLSGKTQTFSSLVGTGGTVSIPGGQLTVNNSTNGVFAGRISSPLSSGTFIKAGTGRLELTGTWDYSGPTSVTAGELKVNGALNAGPLTIAAVATLSGTGPVAGFVTIAGTHAPGNSPGTQTFSGPVTYQAGSSLAWELAGNTAAISDRGTLYDGVDFQGGNLTFSGSTAMVLSFNGAGSTVNWADPFWATSRSGTNGWLVFDMFPVLGGGTTTGASFLAISGSNWLDANGISLLTARPSASFGLQQVGQDVYLTFVAVPEPSTIVLVGVGLAGLALARRRT